MNVTIAGSLLSLVFSSVWVKYKNAKKKDPSVSETQAWIRYFGSSYYNPKKPPQLTQNAATHAPIKAPAN